MKLIVRVDGKGAPRFTLITPSSERQPPTWQRAHWKAFDRPGFEWGVGFDFPETGCYEVRVERGRTVGSLWLRVR